MRALRGQSAQYLVLLAALLYAVLFTYLAWKKQDGFGMGRFDLGNMSQAVWATAQGNILAVTGPTGEEVSRLGLHADPLLVLLAPLYWLWSDPKILLALQSVAVAAGAWPLYRLAVLELGDSKVGGAVWLPVAFAAAYLLYPPLQYALLDEFHPVTLAAPLLLFLIWQLRQGNTAWTLVCALLVLTTREEIGLVVAALGLYALVVWRRRLGAVLVTVGLAWAVLATQVVIPHFNGGLSSDLLQRYRAVGGGIGGVVETALTDPMQIAKVALTADKLGYLAALLAPLLLLSLAAPLVLVVATPELAVNLLSANPAQSSYRFHYVAPLIPFVFWSAILGCKRLLCYRARLGAAVAPALIGLAVAAGWLMGPLPFWSKLPAGSQRTADLFSVSAHDRVVRQALLQVPQDAVVSASNPLGAHLSERRRILVFPQVSDAEFVALDRRAPFFGDARGGVDQRAALLALRQEGGWRSIFDRDGVLVLKRAQREG